MCEYEALMAATELRAVLHSYEIEEYVDAKIIGGDTCAKVPYRTITELAKAAEKLQAYILAEINGEDEL